MKTLTTALALVLALGTVPVLAANARHPYSNIDRRLDKGGDTGDARVDQLNQQQLDAARSQNGGAMMSQPGMGAPMAPAPGMTR